MKNLLPLLFIFLTVSYSYSQNNTKTKTSNQNNQAVEDVNVLWEKAQAAVKSDNIDLATDLLKKIVSNVPQWHFLYAQSYDLLANIYGNDGNVVEMGKALKALEKYFDFQDKLRNQVEETKYFYSVVQKSIVPFEDDLCGIWVSDFSTNGQKLPFIVLKISKNNGVYTVSILPHCTLAKDNKMYTGKPFSYQKKENPKSPTSDTLTYLATTGFITIEGDKNQARFHFGNEKFKEGKEELAAVGQIVVGEIGAATKEIIRSNPNIKEMDAVWQGAAVDGAVLITQLIMKKAAVEKITFVTINMDLERLFPGCAKLYFKQNIDIKSSDGKNSSSESENAMMIYKLYPDYDVHFVSDGYELFGHKEYEKEEITNHKKYKELVANKRETYLTKQLKFNKQAYNNLSENVNKLCRFLFAEDSTSDVPQIIQEQLMYAPQGFTYKYVTFYSNSKEYSFPDEQSDYFWKLARGNFESQPTIRAFYRGWVNNMGKQEGYGHIVYNSHRKYKEYVGEWKNGYFSGEGILTYTNGEVVSGQWRNGRLVK